MPPNDAHIAETSAPLGTLSGGIDSDFAEAVVEFQDMMYSREALAALHRSWLLALLEEKQNRETSGESASCIDYTTSSHDIED